MTACRAKNSVRLIFYLGVFGMLLFKPDPATAGLEGSVGVLSRYIWGGVLMDTGPVLQADLTYVHDTGLFVGTAFSTLDTGSAGNKQVDGAVGYRSTLAGIDYEAGIARHHFTGDGPTDDDASVNRAFFQAAAGKVSVILKRALNDASWTSSGDVYMHAAINQPLPADFRFIGSAGFYYYSDDAVFDSGAVAIAKKQSFAFRDATLSLVRPLLDTRVDLGVHFSIGGERRDGARLDDHVWLSMVAVFP